MDRQTLSRFIESYKSHTCLWNVSNADYTVKQKRINALQDLVPILGEAATIDTVRKKIDIIRNGYFRELKKVNASLSANNLYTPTLWYYDLLTFLSSEEVYRQGTDGLAEPATEASGEGPSQITRKKRGSTITQEELVNVARKLLTECNPNFAADRDNNVEATKASGEGPSQIRKKKRKKRRITETQEELVNAKKLLTEDNPKIAADRDNTFGLYLNQQLQKLSSDQRTFAEKLMSDVLFMARTNQLNATSLIIATRPNSQATTTITERQISQNAPFSSSLKQYVTSPYTQDVRSPPATHTSSAPIIIIKRPTSQNSAHSSSHFPKPFTSKDYIETQVYDHTPSSQKVLAANSLVQNQNALQDLPSTQLSSIPRTLNDETENSAPVHTEQVNTKILKQLLIFKKK